jgi:hypothetical protein
VLASTNLEEKMRVTFVACSVCSICTRNHARIASKHKSRRKDEGDICSMFNALVTKHNQKNARDLSFCSHEPLSINYSRIYCFCYYFLLTAYCFCYYFLLTAFLLFLLLLLNENRNDDHCRRKQETW